MKVIKSRRQVARINGGRWRLSQSHNGELENIGDFGRRYHLFVLANDRYTRETQLNIALCTIRVTAIQRDGDSTSVVESYLLEG